MANKKMSWRTVKIVYRIFEMTNEGNLREPKRNDEYIFYHYSGYSSVEEAAAEIERYDNSYKCSHGGEYVILPIVSTSL